MDEIAAIPLHQWLCACRQLMAKEPAVGAAEFATHLRLEGGFQLQPGWNRVLGKESSEGRETYIYISAERGLTTHTLPPEVDPASVPTVGPEPAPAAEAALWRQARDLAALVASMELADYPPSRVETVMANVEREVMRDASDFDPRSLKELRDTCVGQLEDARNGSRNGQILIADFLQPARDILAAYMAFELTGIAAREVLAFILSVQCTLPSLAPPQATPPDGRAMAIEHLIDQADELLMARERGQVAPFFELTYLAHLLATTAAVLNSHQREFAPGYEGQSHLDSRVLYGEELMAHGTSAAFLLPAAFEPPEMARHVRHRAEVLGESPRDCARSLVVHPAFRAAFLEAENGELDDGTALERYRKVAMAAEPIDALEMVNQKAGPVAEENAKQMHLHLLTYSMG